MKMAMKMKNRSDRHEIVPDTELSQYDDAYM